MNPLLKRLLKISEDHNLPVIVYDSKNDSAGVLMGLDYFEENFGSMPQSINSEFEDCGDTLCEDMGEINYAAVNLVDDLEELEEKITEKIDAAKEVKEFDEIEQSNEELALWKAKREEKEREEIEKTLEEELLENPPADPFEEDLLHTPEWHQLGEESSKIEVATKEELAKEEPAYYPVPNLAGALSWTDWTFTGKNFGPVSPESVKVLNFEENTSEMATEIEGEDPIFLEEPV
jgi:hypothetical protein